MESQCGTKTTQVTDSIEAAITLSGSSSGLIHWWISFRIQFRPCFKNLNLVRP